ncbi:MAG: SDR family oxidoreductase [Bacteroidia bacterium]|nr:SDR family oxidoreductase [Bacteroidia bacterium]
MNITVIGASSGIGKEILQYFVSYKDYKLWASYNKVPIVSSNEGQATYFHYDVLQENNPLEELSIQTLDALIYCPGTVLLKPFEKISLQEFKTNLEVDVLGFIKTLQHFLPSLKKSKSASVVVFSSVAAKIGMPYHASVSIAKAGLDALIRTLAAEYAPKIRFNSIALSLIQTPLTQHLVNTESKVQAISQRHPLKRIGNPSDVVPLVKYLISEESSWITGQNFVIDGGITAIK